MKDIIDLFSVEKAYVEDERVFILEGKTLYAKIKKGMSLYIPFNPSTGLVLPISFNFDTLKIAVVFDDLDDLNIITSLNIGDEILEIYESE